MPKTFSFSKLVALSLLASLQFFCVGCKKGRLVKGGCANDIAIVKASNKDFAKTWESCGTSTLGWTGATANCLKKAYPKLSDACASCFGDFTSTAASKCSSVCYWKVDPKDPKSVLACKRCTDKESLPEWVKCSGLTGDQLPAK